MKKYLLTAIALLATATIVSAASWKTTETEDSSVNGGEIIFIENEGGTHNNWMSLDTLKAWIGNNVSFIASSLSDLKILDSAQPVNGQSLVLDTMDIGDTDDALHVWSIDKIGKANLTTTGILRGRMVFNSYDTAQTLTAETHNASIVQMTVAAEVTVWDCEAVNVGDFVMLWARDAEKIEVVPASGDHFNLFNGTALTAGNELDMAATAGTKVTLICTADDTWSVYSETAASTDGGAAD